MSSHENNEVLTGSCSTSEVLTGSCCTIDSGIENFGLPRLFFTPPSPSQDPLISEAIICSPTSIKSSQGQSSFEDGPITSRELLAEMGPSTLLESENDIFDLDFGMSEKEMDTILR